MINDRYLPLIGKTPPVFRLRLISKLLTETHEPFVLRAWARQKKVGLQFA